MFLRHVSHPGSKPANWFAKPMPERWATELVAAAGSDGRLMPTSHLNDVANDLLTSAEDSLTAAGLTVPGRVLLMHGGFGGIAFDCDLLAVTFDAVRPSGGVLMFTNPDPSCQIVPVADLSVVLLRCVEALTSAAEIPDADAMDAETEALNADGFALVRYLLDQWRAKTLFPTARITAYRDVQFGDLTPVPPQGGLAGWRLPVSVQLSDDPIV